MEFSVIAAALRLGTKYSFQAIRQEALRRISLCYPKDLKDFQLHGEEPCDSPQCSIVWGPFDPIAVLNFARQYDLPDFVPAALYKCANHVSLSGLFLATTQAVGRYHKLSFEDLQDCIRAREYLAEENALLYNAFSELGSAENIVQNRFGIHPHCADGIKTMILDAHNSTFTEGRDALDPLDSWISLYGDHEEDPLCARCVRTLRQLVNGRQLITWSTLSKMFCPTSVRSPAMLGNLSEACLLIHNHFAVVKKPVANRAHRYLHI